MSRCSPGSVRIAAVRIVIHGPTDTDNSRYQQIRQRDPSASADSQRTSRNVGPDDRGDTAVVPRLAGLDAPFSRRPPSFNVGARFRKSGVFRAGLQSRQRTSADARPESSAATPGPLHVLRTRRFSCAIPRRPWHERRLRSCIRPAGSFLPRKPWKRRGKHAAGQ
jgi:hypothetical protein